MRSNIVILIHGTFAKEAGWISENGPLAEKFRDKLSNCHVRPFRWSGNNHHNARLQAGSELAALIDDLHRDNPDTRIHLVAHSHGGNVALYAANATAREAIATLSCLGTPFLTTHARKIVDHARFFVSWTLLGLAFLGMFVGMAVGAEISEFSGAKLVGVVLIFVAGLGWPLICIYQYSRWRTAIAEQIATYLSAFQDSSIHALKTYTPSFPIFIATVPRDEAGLLLNFVDWVTVIPQLGFRFVRLFIPKIAIGCFLAAFLMAIIEGLLKNYFWDVHFSITDVGTYVVLTLFYVGVASAILLPITALITSAIRGNGWSFGGESPRFIMSIRVRARTLPDWPLPWASHALEVSPTPTAFGLRHCSFYENEEVVQEMLDWICRPKVGAISTNVLSKVVTQGRKRKKDGWDVIGTSAILFAVAVIVF